MDLAEFDSGRQNEMEYLTALIALKDESLSAAELQAAVELLLAGQAPTLLQVLRSSGAVQPAQLAAAKRQAQLYIDQQARCGGSQRQDQEPRFANPQSAAAHPSPPTLEADAFISSPAPEPEEDVDWKPTSELLSHVYYVDDTLRSFTAGRLGIASSLALSIALGVLVWSVLQSEIFTAVPAPLASASVEHNARQRVPVAIPVAPASPEPEADAGAMSQPANAMEQTDGELLSRPVSATAADPSAPALPPAPPESESELTRQAERDAAAEADRQEADRKEADRKEADRKEAERREAERQEAERQEAELAEVRRQKALRAQAVRAKALEAEVRAAMEAVAANDLPSALSRMKQLYDETSGTIDLSLDAPWLRLGIGILLEQDTSESIEVAADWLRHLERDDARLSRSMFARWLLRSSVEQKEALIARIAEASPSQPALHSWLLAMNENPEAIPMLEQALEEGDDEALDHFFMAVAYYYAGRRSEVLQQLDLFEAAVSASTASEPGEETQWLQRGADRAVRAKADKLRRLSSLPGS